MANTKVPARLISSTTLTVVARSAAINITLTNGILAVIARSGTISVGVT
jgi:hypothetical protein